jgi:hypothetical protein
MYNALPAFRQTEKVRNIIKDNRTTMYDYINFDAVANKSISSYTDPTVWRIVSDFFINKGFKPNEFSFGAVNFQKKFREVRSENSDNQTRYEQVFDGYEATQTITFSAKKKS